jgi:hypothetical protein
MGLQQKGVSDDERNYQSGTSLIKLTVYVNINFINPSFDHVVQTRKIVIYVLGLRRHRSYEHGFKTSFLVQNFVPGNKSSYIPQTLYIHMYFAQNY